MRILFIIHGFVQGVGYRAHVKRIADRHGIKGMVRNVESGAVEIIAEGNEKVLAAFEKDINVDMRNGPSVIAIERHYENEPEFPKSARSYDGFTIEH